MKNFIYLSLATLILLGACESSNKEEKANTVVKKDTINKEFNKKKENKNTYYDALASVMAGITPTTDTLSNVVHSQTWQKYSNTIQKNWQNKSTKFKILKEWASQELVRPNEIDGGCFYPFAGADILHAALFFPGFKSYYLIGLEPVGSLPPLSRMGEEELDEYFASLEKSMYHILNLSFFRTLSMKVDLTGKRAKDLDGTIHLLLVFLKQLDYNIIDIQPMTFDRQNRLVPADTFNTDAVRIVFTSQGGESPKELFYFSADLSDGHFGKDTPLYSWLQQQPISTTFLKSASYLMHKTYFSHIRTFIIEKSQFILQDDSGIPLRFFTNGQWHIRLYGSYTRPIALFKDWYQKELHDLYRKKENVKDLPFGIGYKYRKGESTLMLMEKIK